jgi:dolichyl-phosphate beta-glucosyltransferase
VTGAETAAQSEHRTELSVVIPALNEAGRLPPTLDRIGAYLSAHPDWQPAEIIVVDDGSSDGTAAESAAVDLPSGIDLRVAKHPTNRGKGAAVRTGFGLTTGHWVLLSDADLSSPIEELPVLAKAASRDCIVVGSRAVERRLVEIRQPRHRDLMGRTFNLMLRMLRLNVELLLLADHWGFGSREIGVRWHHVEASRVMAVRHSAEMFGAMLRLWWWRVRGSLDPLPKGLE